MRINVACLSVAVSGFLLTAPLRRAFATFTLQCSQCSFFLVLHGGVLMLDCGLVALGLELSILVVEFCHVGRGEGFH